MDTLGNKFIYIVLLIVIIIVFCVTLANCVYYYQIDTNGSENISATEAQQLSILNGVTCFLVALIGVMIVYMLLIPQNNLDKIKIKSDELEEKERENISTLDEYEALQKELEIRAKTKQQMTSLVNQLTPELDEVEDMKERISQLEAEKIEMSKQLEEAQQLKLQQSQQVPSEVVSHDVLDHISDISDEDDGNNEKDEIDENDVKKRVENIESIHHLEDLGIVHSNPDDINPPISVDTSNRYNLEDDESTSSFGDNDDKSKSSSDSDSVSSVDTFSTPQNKLTSQATSIHPISPISPISPILPILPISPISPIASLDYGIKVDDLDELVNRPSSILKTITPVTSFTPIKQMRSIPPVASTTQYDSTASSPNSYNSSVPRYQRFRSLMSNYDEQ